MAKGQQKKSREDKKPKQDKSQNTKPKSAYAMSMSTQSAPPPFAKKK